MKDDKAYVTLGNLGTIVNRDFTFTINYGADTIAVNANYNYGDYEINRDYELAYTESGWRMNKISEIE